MTETTNPDVKRIYDSFDRFAKAEWRKKTFWGMKPSEVRALVSIRDISRKSDNGATVSEISKWLCVTSPTVTQIIKSLSSNGCIIRSTDSKDKRTTEIKLTEKGQQIVQKATESFNSLFSGLIDVLGKEQSDTLVSLLNQVYAYFEEASKGQFD
ncbi:MarR family transcriptional regulator [Paenibacillus psychroresistens]|uniref:MarR family transcriptional regulator n=1 Tax=Paenibacillus psychroresistens TaxID=1778678 RepID=A0A6B8RFA8_9BACL|nr:MarR family winged helix-turn-helix transcriptional regulator [Paenibacillus psychroresistens]QGQ94046.1 MarR family transcriptional regulator [Paenibacillus psychroresistens]